MKEHKGLRPQDIPILLKIAVKNDHEWFMKDIASELNISRSEVSESINRSKYAGFLDDSGRHIRKHALLEFLVHGIKYVFPEKPGGQTRGILTAHSASPINERITGEIQYVWPTHKGKSLGFAVKPLYKGVVDAVENDAEFYEMMALIDAIRVGKARERELATAYLAKKLNISK
jgi:hypothetical protein